MPLYHMAPHNMSGTILMSLNEIEHTMPDIYQLAIQKYKGRELTMERTIPHLECRWNDVINLCPVHPSHIMKQRIRAGQEWWQTMWYEIDPEIAGLNSDNSVIWTMQPGSYCNETAQILDPTHFIRYASDVLDSLKALSARARWAYRNASALGTTKLLFNCVPHIFFKGIIDTTQHRVIKII